MPRPVDHDHQRRELLERSFSLFAERGYGGVSMRGLARELGVSTGTLYHYFEGKPDIFGQMLGMLAERDIAEVTDALEGQHSLSVRLERLGAWLEARADYASRLLLLALDAWQVAPDDRDALARTARTYRDALADRLQLPSPALGSLFFSLVLGALAHRVLDPESGALGPQVDALRALTTALGGSTTLVR